MTNFSTYIVDRVGVPIHGRVVTVQEGRGGHMRVYTSLLGEQ